MTGLEKRLAALYLVVDTVVADDINEHVMAVVKERDRYKEALKDLVWLKILKDNEGKTTEYLENMPKAWESAKAALAERVVEEK